ncbi:hypothetical protein [Ammoniphilus sp. CFH 90114]|uniref:hypothetical protein n=1 Tax=Ammoniphilus sp. CFH 90114 TaxID=2493665 RepID=UPI0013E95AF4|nr:hypothetical protein [Ammoniphilus sp. CFH 90114]
MPDRKQPNDQAQRKNAVGQIQEQLENQAQALETVQSNQQQNAKAVASVQQDQMD